MSGYLDAAVLGVCITEPTLKRSQKGTPYLRVLLAVGEGDARQFVWACCFGEVAERVAGQLKKGGKLYAEGQLTAEIYERDGKPTVSLNIAARRGEVLNPSVTSGTQHAPSQRRPLMQHDSYLFNDKSFDGLAS